MPAENSRIIQWGLYAIALSCVLAAIGHAIWPDRVDDKTAMFLGLGAVVLIIREVSKIEFPGWKIERVREELKAEVQQVDKKVELIENRGRLPGRPEPARARASNLAAANDDIWFTDPNRGKFGGSSTANGRVLEAEIAPAAGPQSSACIVRLRVRSTDDQRPLTGNVTFHLHPTFGEREHYDAPVVNGIAEDKFTSWGVFTVGAVADDGQTKLELNLRNVKGGTQKFYMN